MLAREIINIKEIFFYTILAPYEGNMLDYVRYCNMLDC